MSTIGAQPDGVREGDASVEAPRAVAIRALGDGDCGLSRAARSLSDSCNGNEISWTSRDSRPYRVAMIFKPKKFCNRAWLARLSLKRTTPTRLENDHMKIRTNFARLVFAALGVALCLSNAAPAAERAKTTRTQDHRAGAVAGRLSATFGNQVIYGAGETVTLTPLSGGQAITIKTDAEGRFLFGGLSPGQYELKTQVNWTTTYIELTDDGSSERMYADHWKQVVGRVQVKSGQTVHVTSFNEGETRNAFYAYGGTLSRPHHPLVTCD